MAAELQPGVRQFPTIRWITPLPPVATPRVSPTSLHPDPDQTDDHLRIRPVTDADYGP